MALGALKLADRLAIPVQAEPFEPVDDRAHCSLCRTLAIGVLDAQKELAPEMLGVEPVEQSRARAADVQKSCRRRRETGDNGGHEPIRERELRIWTARSSRRRQALQSPAKAHIVLVAIVQRSFACNHSVWRGVC
jgi:hypothetical protein